MNFVSWPIALATFRERALRPTTIVFTVLMMAFGLFSVFPQPWTGATAFTGTSLLWVFLLTLTIGGGILADEIDSGHAQLVLLRPITRAQWVTGRFFGAAAALKIALIVGWLPSFIKGASQGDVLARLFVLPLGILSPVAWLATLLALSAVLRSWGNCAAAIAGALGWFLIHYGAPLLLKSEQLKTTLDLVNPYVGPQDALDLARQFATGNAVTWSTALYDLFWCLLAWTVAVILVNQRELARRRA